MASFTIHSKWAKSTENDHRVSLELKARLGFGFYDHRGGVPKKNNAGNRITLFNYFLISTFTRFTKRQRIMSSPHSSPTNEALSPARSTTESRAWEASLRPRGAPGMCHPVPLPAPPARGRSQAYAHRGCGPVTPAACSRFPAGSGPRQAPDPGSPPSSPPAAPLRPPTIPARLCLQAASRGPTLKCFPAAARQPDPGTQGSR